MSPKGQLLKTKPPTHTKRAWVRASDRWPAKVQLSELAKHGITERMVYNSAKGDTTADMCGGLAAGDHLYVYGSHRLGGSKSEYSAVLDALRRKRIVIHDILREIEISGRELTAAYLVADDLREIAGEARTEAAGWNRKLIKRLSKKEAEIIWKNPNILTDSEAATMAKWHPRSLRRWFGPSGRKPGRRREKR